MQRIGFDRMIKLDWIEYYAKISRHEEDTGKLKEQMHETLFEECPQMASRKKNITILQRIWTRVEAEATAVSTQSTDTVLTMTVDFRDFNKKIKIAPPI
jgi:hypothetical protein